jgi:hypothetical protein
VHAAIATIVTASATVVAIVRIRRIGSVWCNMTAMDDLKLARSIAAGRILFGALMLFIPNTVLARASAERPGPLVWLARAFGIRDIVLGLGALKSLSEPEPDPSWVKMGAVADSCDAVAAVVWRDELGTAGTLSTLALAVPAAAGGWKAASGLS